MMSQLTLVVEVVVGVLGTDGEALPEALPEGLAEALADALASAPSAVWLSFVTAEPPVIAITTPITRAKTTGIATMSVMRPE
jgi:hypothetical protein